MDCDKARRCLHEALEPGAPDDPGGLTEHLLECPACHRIQRDLQLLRRSAPALPVAPLPAGFELALRRQLRQIEGQPTGQGMPHPSSKSEQPKVARSHKRAVGALVAAAASVALIWAAVRLAGNQDERPRPRLHRLSVAAHAPREIPTARFDIELPPGVEVAHELGALFGRGRHLSWQSRLRPGINAFDLPLVVSRSGARVRARVSAEGRSSTVTVLVGQPGTEHALRSAGVIRLALANRSAGLTAAVAAGGGPQ